MTDPFNNARKRQLARLDGTRPPTARAAMALAKSQAYQDAADAPATLRAYAADLANYKVRAARVRADASHPGGGRGISGCCRRRLRSSNAASTSRCDRTCVRGRRPSSGHQAPGDPGDTPRDRPEARGARPPSSRTGNSAGNTDIGLGNGANQITLAGSGNVVDAGNGANVVTGGVSNNTVILGNGLDSLTLSGGNNTVTMGKGLDNVKLSGGGNTITFGNGADAVSVGGSGNQIKLGKGIDVVHGLRTPLIPILHRTSQRRPVALPPFRRIARRGGVRDALAYSG